MISSANFKTCNWSNAWTSTEVKDGQYYLERKGLESIVSTRLDCQKSDDKNIEWPFIAIHLNHETYKCNIKSIESAFDIIPDDIRETIKDDPTLESLLEKKIEVITYKLLKLNFFCAENEIDVRNEVLVNTIKIIEKYREDWIRSLMQNPDTPFYPYGTPLSLVVLTNRQTVIEFSKKVEKATSKIIHEAYDYDSSKAFVCIRPKDPKSWKKELRVYRTLLSEGLLKSPDSGFVPTFHIDDKLALQIRCIGDMLLGVRIMDNQRKMHVALKIAQTLELLHRFDITHGDIKLENILFDEDRVYLIDFGLSHFEKLKKVSVYFGTRGMLPPELIRDAFNYGTTKVIGKFRDFSKFDSFSFGVLLWSMCYNVRSPFEKETDPFNFELYEAEIKKMEKLPKPSSGTIGHVMRGLMKFDPKKRWKIQKASEILSEIMRSKDLKRGFDGCDFLDPYKQK